MRIWTSSRVKDKGEMEIVKYKYKGKYKYKYKGKYKYIKGLPAARTHRCINKPDSLC